MTRATTPKHQFVLEIDPSEWDKYLITYSQDGEVILEKNEDDGITIEEVNDSTSGATMYRMSFRLSQAETKLFKAKTACEVQIRCHYPDGNSFASDIMQLRVTDVLNDEELG